MLKKDEEIGKTFLGSEESYFIRQEVLIDLLF